MFWIISEKKVDALFKLNEQDYESDGNEEYNLHEGKYKSS